MSSNVTSLLSLVTDIEELITRDDDFVLIDRINGCTGRNFQHFFMSVSIFRNLHTDNSCLNEKNSSSSSSIFLGQAIEVSKFRESITSRVLGLEASLLVEHSCLSFTHQSLTSHDIDLVQLHQVVREQTISYTENRGKIMI